MKVIITIEDKKIETEGNFAKCILTDMLVTCNREKYKLIQEAIDEEKEISISVDGKEYILTTDILIFYDLIDMLLMFIKEKKS